MRIPISFKLFIMTFTILLLAMIPTAYRNYSQVKKEAVDREWQFISTQSQAKTQEIEWILKNLIENSLQSATYIFEKNYNKNINNDVLNPFTKNDFMKSIDLYDISSQSAPQLFYRESKSQAETHTHRPLQAAEIEKMRDTQKNLFPKVAQGQIYIKKYSHPEISIFTILLPISKNENGQINRIACIDIDTNIFNKAFDNLGSSLSYLVDSEGELLAHSDINFRKNASFRHMPLVEKSIEDKNKNQLQQKFSDPNYKKDYIGSFTRTQFGPTLIFQSSLQDVLAPAEQVKVEFIKNLFYVLSLSFVFISLFSRSLTRPLEKLVDLIPQVSQGQFDLQAEAKINSNDEVGDLAKAFDEMTTGLAERDKVKTLFQKFHGTHVANDILSSELVLGGQKKNVIVFFSDIRGFTAFSESRAPEEVVEMLNEYFAVMVDIINRNGGVVDKFIGDAIMAVWGAPNSGERDAHNAVSACLQMRIALNELNDKRIQENKIPIQIGMGLHAGQAISGTIGSNDRMEYTVIGNTVNTASRVEASTKAFGADLLITREVAEHVQDDFLLAEAGSAEVKGRSEPLSFFKVSGYLSHETGEWVEVKTPYSEYEKEDSEKVKVA